MFKVYLSEIKFNQIIKDKSNKDVYYDVYTFLRVEGKKIVGKEYQDKWVRKDSDFQNSLPEMIEGSFYYIELGLMVKYQKYCLMKKIITIKILLINILIVQQ
ncbi:MAG: hypothetical protein CXB60_06370 [Spiroplasma poulsonii]|nr:hypothetical protein [Spiroplasma poulsonii]